MSHGARRALGLLREGRLFPMYDGLISMRSSPLYPGLVILNYTNLTQYSRKWDDVTRACRGLIIDTRDWSIAALPFGKFFNLGEVPESMPENLPSGAFTVSEKIDGSLGIGFWYDGEFKVATRGSFDSVQAEWATAYVNNHRRHILKADLPKNITPLFEIVYNANPSVIHYEYEGLVMLAAFDRWNMTELSPAASMALASKLYLIEPHVYTFGTMQEAAVTAVSLPATAEGFVVRFANGLRIKLKGDAYKEMHRLVWQYTDKRVIEAIVSGGFENYLALLPEELRADAEVLSTAIAHEAEALAVRAGELFQSAPKTSRKDFALYVTSLEDAALIPTLFQMFDGKDIDWVVLAAKLRA